MNDIQTTGESMKVFSKRQLLALEINALCVLTNDRCMNSGELGEIAKVPMDYLETIPFHIKLTHHGCDCFDKHKWN